MCYIEVKEGVFHPQCTIAQCNANRIVGSFSQKEGDQILSWRKVV